MKKLKFFFTDFGNIVALIMVTLIYIAMTAYTIYSIGWYITSVVYVFIIGALIKSSNDTYKTVKDLRDKGYDV